MTNDYWHHTQNGTEKKPANYLPTDKYKSPMENAMTLLIWQLWTMQVLLEIWGGVFGFLSIFGLFVIGGWPLAGPPALAYLLVGVLLTWKYGCDPLSLRPHQHIWQRIPAILMWPTWQILREMHQTILINWPSVPNKQPETFYISIAFVWAIVKWFFVCSLVIGIPTLTAVILEKAWS